MVLCEKAPNVLSRCHTKRRMRLHGQVHPSVGMTSAFDTFFCRCRFRTKKSPSFHWYDIISGHQRPFCVTQFNYVHANERIKPCTEPCKPVRKVLRSITQSHDPCVYQIIDQLRWSHRDLPRCPDR